MGRLLGSYDSDELDRPDLNKCPDCGCFFATDTCTLCGKICPEEMRAGNRAAVKKRKRRTSTGRVQFVPWYYTWPAMIIIFLVMPLAGVILFFTSPYSKKVKIIVGAVFVVAALIYTGVASMLIGLLFDRSPVNDDVSRAEYMEMCAEMTAEEFHRRSTESGFYVTMDLTVIGQLPSSWFGDTDEVRYYRCRGEDGESEVLLLDCILEDRMVLREGDMICVWGESAGGVTFYSAYDRAETLPCLNTAYCDLIG